MFEWTVQMEISKDTAPEPEVLRLSPQGKVEPGGSLDQKGCFHWNSVPP